MNYRYRMMVLITEGTHKSLYYSREVSDMFELANIYENEFDVIERCDYILDKETGKYLTKFDKNAILESARIRYKYEPFGAKDIYGYF